MAETGGLAVLDAEEGDTSEWSSTVVTSGMTFDAHADALNHGSYGFRSISDGVGENARGILTFTEQSEVYVRFYLYIDPTAMSYAQNTGHTICDVLDNATGITLYLFREAAGSGNLDSWRLYNDITGSSYDGTGFARGEWLRVEIHAKRAASGVTIELIVNGTTVFQVSANTEALYWDRISLGYRAVTPANGNYIYLDDVKLDTTGPIGAYSDAGGSSIAVLAAIHAARRRQ